jgi:PmbA protein
MSLEFLLDLALRSGAEAAEVYQSTSRSRPAFFEANRLKQLESIQAEGVALRLWYQGRPGIAVGYGPVDAQVLVERAIALSALNEPEAANLASGWQQSFVDGGDLLEPEQLIAWGQGAIAQIRDQYPEVLCSGEWSCSTETTRLINSQGLDLSHRDTSFSGTLEAEWIRGDDFLAVYESQVSREDLPPQVLVKAICQRLAWSQENVSPQSERIPVLLLPKAADLLWDIPRLALSGRQVIEQSSPWSHQRGATVAVEQLSLRQDPTLGPYSSPFDDEGLATQSFNLINQGQLEQFYTDQHTGQLLGTESTGNGMRPDLGSSPLPGLINLIVSSGSQSTGALMRNLDRGLVLDQVLGGGGGISGDFSINIDLGFWVEGGVIQGRVKDAMLAGNAYDALRQIVDLGSELEWQGSTYTPAVLVEGLSLTTRL